MTLWGVMAEFDNGDALVEATKHAREAGYLMMDAYTPHDIEGLSELLGARPTWLPYLVFGCGLLGGCAGFFMQWYANVVSFPWDIGGRPWLSSPSYIPITFELTILFAAFAALLGMISINGLPRPYHPVFNVPAFDRATQDRYFLCIEASDPRFDGDGTPQFLTSLNPLAVHEVTP